MTAVTSVPIIRDARLARRRSSISRERAWALRAIGAVATAVMPRSPAD